MNLTEIWHIINHDFSFDFKHRLPTVCGEKLLTNVHCHLKVSELNHTLGSISRRIRYRVRMRGA